MQNLNVFVNLGNLDLVSDTTIRYCCRFLEMIRDAPNVRGINVIIPAGSENPFTGHFPAEVQTDDDIFNLYLLNLHNWGSAVTSTVLSCMNRAKKLNVPVVTSPDDLHWFIHNSGILAPDWDGTWLPDQLKWMSYKSGRMLAHLDEMLSFEQLRPYPKV